MSRIFLDLSPFYFLKQSLTEPEVHPIKQDWLVSELRGSLGLHLYPVLGLQTIYVSALQILLSQLSPIPKSLFLGVVITIV